MVFCVNECDQGAIVLIWAGFFCWDKTYLPMN